MSHPRFDPELETQALSLIRTAVAANGDGLVMSSSFGIHSAALLDLATRVRPDIPVVFVDTGYLPPETYHFADALTQRLELNVQRVQADLSTVPTAP